MNDVDLDDLRVFVRVVDRGGFAVTARELGVPTSTVSRTIARLEAKTGTRLLQRTPRSVRATSEGRAIYASIRDAVATLEQATRSLEPASKRPKGVLRISAPHEIGAAFLADVAVAFTERYPLVPIDLVLTNRAVSLVEEGIDIAVRAAAKLPDSSLVARKVGELTHSFFAAPGYLARHGAPIAPADLVHHRCIVFRAKELLKTLRIFDENGPMEIEVRGQIAGDDFGYIRAATLAGGGIALMPRFICAKDEAAGRLVRVLPMFAAKGAVLFLLYPSSAQVPARVTAFRDFAIAAFDARATV